MSAGPDRLVDSRPLNLPGRTRRHPHAEHAAAVRPLRLAYVVDDGVPVPPAAARALAQLRRGRRDDPVEGDPAGTQQVGDPAPKSVVARQRTHDMQLAGLEGSDHCGLVTRVGQTLFERRLRSGGVTCPARRHRP